MHLWHGHLVNVDRDNNDGVDHVDEYNNHDEHNNYVHGDAAASGAEGGR